MNLELGSQRFVLLPEGAVYWPDQDSLVVADLHWGKATLFRFHGIASPIGAEETDVESLVRLLQQTGSRRLIVLGDWIHSEYGGADALSFGLERLRAKLPRLEIVWVLGNHDRVDISIAHDLGIEVTGERLVMSGIGLAHQEADFAEPMPCIVGHEHPVVQVRLGGRERRRLRCFKLERECLTLPAFGVFTGGSKVVPEGDTRVFGIAGDSVVEVTSLCCTRRC